jgi:3'(2'), 5'-bisphosphate nucleotidase
MPNGNPRDREVLLDRLLKLVAQAGDTVWDHFERASGHELKRDRSPVTAADREGERIILAGLADFAPDVPVVAEEEAAAGRVPDVDSAFFLVDPLDGTAEFINKGTDFTVNIGLVEDGSPTLGVVYAPARGALYWGDVKAGAAYVARRLPHGVVGEVSVIRVCACAATPRAVASRSHSTPETEAWLNDTGISDRIPIGSSLKLMLVACGEADVYPRPAPTMEWDLAAGDAILRAAGGRVLDPDGFPMRYGKPRFFNPGFVATGPFEPRLLRPYLNPAEGPR